MLRYLIAAAILGSIAALAPGDAARAQQAPDDLTFLPPVSTEFVPARTPWDDPDFRGTWPYNRLNEMHILMERPKELGNQVWLTEKAYAEQLDEARKQDGSFKGDWRGRGTQGLAAWLESTKFGRRNSLLIDPPDGRFPALTPQAQALKDAHRDSFVKGLDVDWVSDLDVAERCVTRGFPASMFPSRDNNNAVRIFQAPGLVALQLEMIHETRIIPIVDDEAERKRERWPLATRTWMGQGIGHWEGNTLVIETTNIIAGDNTTWDVSNRAAVPYDRIGGTPMSARATVVERLTMLDHGRMNYDVTYSDPEVFTAPWTARLEWTRDEGYQMYEFACHEGNVQVRDMINESRSRRRDGENGVKVEKVESPYKFPEG